MAGLVNLLGRGDDDLLVGQILGRLRVLLVTEVVRPLVSIPPLLAPRTVVVPAGRCLLRRVCHVCILTGFSEIR